jgi:hypothetical protein
MVGNDQQRRIMPRPRWRDSPGVSVAAKSRFDLTRPVRWSSSQSAALAASVSSSSSQISRSVSGAVKPAASRRSSHRTRATSDPLGWAPANLVSAGRLTRSHGPPHGKSRKQETVIKRAIAGKLRPHTVRALAAAAPQTALRESSTSRCLPTARARLAQPDCASQWARRASIDETQSQLGRSMITRRFRYVKVS